MDITKGKGQREEGRMGRTALKIFTPKFPNPSFSNFFPRIEEKQKKINRFQDEPPKLWGERTDKLGNQNRLSSSPARNDLNACCMGSGIFSVASPG
jgi:hypothetical protein